MLQAIAARLSTHLHPEGCLLMLPWLVLLLIIEVHALVTHW
jgi:hypothetical protein